MIIGVDRPLVNDPHSLYPFSSFPKTIFSFSKYNIPFPSPFYFSLAKKNSFSKYHPPFSSLFIFSSKDPKRFQNHGAEYLLDLITLYFSVLLFLPQKCGLKVPKLGPTCQVHLVQLGVEQVQVGCSNPCRLCPSRSGRSTIGQSQPGHLAPVRPAAKMWAFTLPSPTSANPGRVIQSIRSPSKLGAQVEGLGDRASVLKLQRLKMGS